MKKIYLLLGLVSYQTFSQDSRKSIPGRNEITFTAAVDIVLPNDRLQSKVFLKKNGIYVQAYINNIPSAVMGDFIKKYEEVKTVSWKVDDNEVTGYFYSNNEKTVVTYKKNGHLVSTRKTYDSTRLTRSVKAFLQAEINKGFSTNLITEVVDDQMTLYEVNMVNQSQICVVRLSKTKNGELEVTEKVFYNKVSAEAI